MKPQQKKSPAAVPESPDGLRPIQWGEILCLVLVLCGAGAIRIRLLDVPLERDEGECAVMAQVLLRGERPYQAACNMKLPGAFLAYALLLRGFGESAAAIHWGLFVVTSASAVLFWLLARRWFDRATALVAAMAFSILTLSVRMLGFTANTEQFLVPPLIAGWLIIGHDGLRRPLRMCAGGLSFGLAILMKQHGAAFAACAAIWLATTELRRCGWKAALRQTSAFGAGVVAPYAVVVTWLAARGAFSEFWFWTVTYARHYVATFTVGTGLSNLARTGGGILSVEWPVFAAAFVGMTALLWDARIRERAGPMLAFTAGAVLAVCPGWMFREHYFLMAAPSAALWCGVGITALARRAVNRGAGLQGVSLDRAPAVARRSSRGQVDRWHEATGSRADVLVVVLSLFSIGGSVWFERDYLFRMTPEQIIRYCYGTSPFIESPEVARYLREHTSPNEPIAVIGSEPQIYFYADRRAATRYIYTFPLMEPHPFALSMQRELCREVETAEPRYLVYVSASTSWLARPSSPREIFSWLLRITTERYELVSTIEIPPTGPTRFLWEVSPDYRPQTESFVAIFRRKEPSGSSSD